MITTELSSGPGVTDSREIKCVLGSGQLCSPCVSSACPRAALQRLRRLVWDGGGVAWVVGCESGSCPRSQVPGAAAECESLACQGKL